MRSHVFLVVAALTLIGPRLDATCGCDASDRPCTQEALASVPLPVADDAPVAQPVEMTFDLAHCWGCSSAGEGVFVFVGFVALAIVIVSGILAVFSRPKLAILRLTPDIVFSRPDIRHPLLMTPAIGVTRASIA